MPQSSNVLIMALAFAFLAFLVFAATTFRMSPGDIAMFVAFGVVLVLIAYVSLSSTRARKPAAARFGFPRIIRVIFASYAAAFALAMLLAILALPWSGYKGFEFFFGPEHSWALLPLGVILFPFVWRRLQ